MVLGRGFEPLTLAMSMQCSTTELTERVVFPLRVDGRKLGGYFSKGNLFFKKMCCFFSEIRVFVRFT